MRSYKTGELGVPCMPSEFIKDEKSVRLPMYLQVLKNLRKFIARSIPLLSMKNRLSSINWGINIILAGI